MDFPSGFFFFESFFYTGGIIANSNALQNFTPAAVRTPECDTSPDR
jgi:hypothetical protein